MTFAQETESFAGMKKPIHIAWVLVISFAVFHVGPIIDQSARWTDHYFGFMNGLFMSLLLSIIWIVAVVPWLLLVYGLYRWHGWTRYRTAIALVPSFLMLLVSLGELAFRPPDPYKRFEQFAHTPIPKSATSLHFHHEGGGFADYGDVYYFVCSKGDAQALIGALAVSLLEGEGVDSYASFRTLPGAPDFHSWPGRRIYQRYDEKRGWFYHVVTDASETQVYVSLSCI